MDKPIFSAILFIIFTNSSSVPAIPSAKAIQASLPDTIIIPFNKFSTLTLSLGIINIEENPFEDILQAFFDTLNFSSNFKSPFLIKSKATIAVIIFVIEAGDIFCSLFFSNKTSPDKTSIR